MEIERNESGQVLAGGAGGIVWLVVGVLAIIALLVWLSPHIN